MHILITGAAGFIGQLLAGRLLDDSSHTLILADVVEPPIPPDVKHPQNAKPVKVDLVKDAASVVTKDLDAVYVFHGIMSAGSEADFDLGMQVNLTATLALFSALRSLHKPTIRVIYASSNAIYGQPLPVSGVVTDSTLPTPESSYGCAKLMCEALVNEYTRRGFFSGFSLRFPTVTVRPGKPTAAASSFLSGIIREPLQGRECVVPIGDRAFEAWVCSPQVLGWNLVHVLTLEGGVLDSHRRGVNMPGICVSVQEMRDALREVGGEKALDYVKEEEDAELVRILRSWSNRADNSTALRLGFRVDESFADAVRDYKESLDKGRG